MPVSAFLIPSSVLRLLAVLIPSPYGEYGSKQPLYNWLNYAIENSVCGADFMFRLFSGFSLKFAFKNPQIPLFHHIGAEWYKTHEIYLYYTILLKFFVWY